jgi:hypothetical protein
MGEVLDYKIIDYRKDLGILFFRFISPVSSRQLQEAYLAALEAGRQHQTHCWLVDLRRRGIAGSQDEAWLLNDFFPMVESHIPGQHYFAYLVTPNFLPYVREHLNLNLELTRDSRPRTHLKISDSEQQAVEWLCNRPGIH